MSTCGSRWRSPTTPTIGRLSPGGTRSRLSPGFSRLTQLGLLRLLTTVSAMGGQPLTNEEAWRVYDDFLSDSRVRVFPELPALEDLFRSYSSLRQASPKLWVDAYLAAHAAANEAILVSLRSSIQELWCRMPYPDLNRAGQGRELSFAAVGQRSVDSHSTVMRNGRGE